MGLWGDAFFNGVFDRLDTVTRTLRFPGSRPLRSAYTNIAPLDAQLTLLSAFYDVLTNSLTSGSRLLFFDVNYAVACANLWVLVESRRRGVRSWFLKYNRTSDTSVLKQKVHVQNTRHGCSTYHGRSTSFVEEITPLFVHRPREVANINTSIFSTIKRSIVATGKGIGTFDPAFFLKVSTCSSLLISSQIQFCVSDTLSELHRFVTLWHTILLYHLVSPKSPLARIHSLDKIPTIASRTIATLDYQTF
jgi:hypothetical protein